MADKRILLFTGKGGVGKTTIAAATAVSAAKRGYKTLIMSTDPAHSLADALDVTLGPEPEEIHENLYALEIDLYYSMKKYWGSIRDLLLVVLKWQGLETVAAEELAAIPGMGEGSALLWLDKFYHEDDYELIIIDSAPTGETLTLLSLPQITHWWLMQAFPFQRFAVRTVGKAARMVTGVPFDKGYDELEEIFNKLNRIQEVMSNANISSIRLVMNPERMVIQESRRAFTYLQLYGFTVDAVIVNRIIEEAKAGELFKNYLKSQKGYLKEIEDSFSPLPIYKVPHLGKEVFGFNTLIKVGKRIYENEDPAVVLYNESIYELKQENNDYIMRLHIPFIDDADYTVQQFGDELVVQIKNQRRNFFLPSFLNYYRMSDKKFEDGWLTVIFSKQG